MLNTYFCQIAASILGFNNFQVKVIYGEWSAALNNAGGCQNEMSSYATNPQYALTVTEPDDDDEDCSVVVGLMQIFRREARSMGLRMLEIGFSIFEVFARPNRPLMESNGVSLIFLPLGKC